MIIRQRSHGTNTENYSDACPVCGRWAWSSAISRVCSRWGVILGVPRAAGGRSNPVHTKRKPELGTINGNIWSCQMPNNDTPKERYRDPTNPGDEIDIRASSTPLFSRIDCIVVWNYFILSCVEHVNAKFRQLKLINSVLKSRRMVRLTALLASR